jgi:uncharacterized protein YutE (UPF0331/DUF86 family)
VNPKNVNLEKKIKEIVEEYSQKGYRVFSNGDYINIPNFLKNYSPDIIAMSEEDKVVIEVRTKYSLSKSNNLENLANLINQQKGWRFELIMVNSKETEDNEREDLSINEIMNMLNEAERLLDNKHVKASFILTWSSIEAIVRNKLKSEKINSDINNPIKMIKNLYTFGLVSRDEYEFLHTQFKLRNSVVHGFKAPNLDTQKTQALINLAKNLF